MKIKKNSQEEGRLLQKQKVNERDRPKVEGRKHTGAASMGRQR
jgi:hypothetical protein